MTEQTKRRGRPSKGDLVAFNARLPRELKDRLVDVANESGLTLTDFLTTNLERILNGESDTSRLNALRASLTRQIKELDQIVKRA